MKGENVFKKNQKIEGSWFHRRFEGLELVTLHNEREMGVSVSPLDCTRHLSVMAGSRVLVHHDKYKIHSQQLVP